MNDTDNSKTEKLDTPLKKWEKPEIKTVEIADTAGAALMGNDGGGMMTGS